MNIYHNKKRSILIALFLALLGLTVLPGFKCTAEDASGNKITVDSN